MGESLGDGLDIVAVEGDGGEAVEGERVPVGGVGCGAVEIEDKRVPVGGVDGSVVEDAVGTPGGGGGEGAFGVPFGVGAVEMLRAGLLGLTEGDGVEAVLGALVLDAGGELVDKDLVGLSGVGLLGVGEGGAVAQDLSLR